MLQARTTCELLTASRRVPAASSDPFWPISPSSPAAGPTTSPYMTSPSTPRTASQCLVTAICLCPARSTATHHAISIRRPTGRVRTEPTRGVPIPIVGRGEQQETSPVLKTKDEGVDWGGTQILLVPYNRLSFQ